MHVVATAGHVDHGKSTLVRRLTGTDPDRLAEEQRRGLTITLGYAWTRLEPVGDVAFVDVPGHERFISTTLAGVGPVPAALLVVAADDPWMPQAAEHLACLDALGVRHAVVAVSRSDLAHPGPAVAVVRAELAGTSLEDAPVVPVSGRTGAGLDGLRTAIGRMVAALPAPDPDADVRLWVDRAFSVPGAGTVVTGTLPAGTIRVGDVLVSGATRLRVRGLQSLGRPVDTVAGVARVAVNVVGTDAAAALRHGVLLTPDAWQHATEVDVAVVPVRGTSGPPPLAPQLHVGATHVTVRCRPLSEEVVRLRLGTPLPLRVGDRALLRDSGSRQAWGVRVLDPDPPSLRRRGSAARRAASLAGCTTSDLRAEVARRGIVSQAQLRRLGVPVGDGEVEGTGILSADGWFLSAERAALARAALSAAVDQHERSAPLAPGLPLTTVAARLGLPTVELARAVVEEPLQVEGGRVTRGPSGRLPRSVRDAVGKILDDLAADPFAAPDADRLAELHLDERALAAADRAGLVLRLTPGIVVARGADRLAAGRLALLPQPFTAGEARSFLGTTRRIAVPLLEHLGRAGLTRRLPDGRHRVVDGSPLSPAAGRSRRRP
jgi:selenocysteine-specific elongation factor